MNPILLSCWYCCCCCFLNWWKMHNLKNDGYYEQKKFPTDPSFQIFHLRVTQQCSFLTFSGRAYIFMCKRDVQCAKTCTQTMRLRWHFSHFGIEQTEKKVSALHKKGTNCHKLGNPLYFISDIACLVHLQQSFSVKINPNNASCQPSHVTIYFVSYKDLF